jgi:hypothetical protein
LYPAEQLTPRLAIAPATPSQSIRRPFTAARLLCDDNKSFCTHLRAKVLLQSLDALFRVLGVNRINLIAVQLKYENPRGAVGQQQSQRFLKTLTFPIHGKSVDFASKQF